MKLLRSLLPLIALALASTQAAHAACTPITLAPGDVNAGTVGTPYNLTFSASGSGATPFAYEVTSGVLPAGLNLDSVTGALTGTPTAAGSFPLTVSATDTAGCSGGRAYVLSTAQGTQTISFTSTAPAGATVGGPTYAVTATATSGLPVAFTIDASATSVCSIAGSTVSFIGIGTCVIDANQAGDANYGAAAQVQQSFGVAQGTQTITFTSTPPAAASVGGPTYNVTATASSGLPVAFTIDATATSVCSIAGSTVSFLAAGTCVIDADQAGNANYAAAPQAQQSFGVGKSAQTITFTSTAPAAATVGGATYTVTATASSGLTVAFTIDASASSVCSIAGSTVSFTGAGNCVIDANQAGDINYNPAPQVQQTFAVGKGAQTITYTSTAPAGAVVGGATYSVTATASSGLAVAFTIDASASGVCTIAGSTVSFIGVGNCVIDANQAGDANYNAAPQVQQSFAVGKGSQTISFTSTAPAGASVGGATYTVTATASSGLTVAFTIDASAASVCSIAGSTVSFIGVGTCVIDANQAGNANYNAAPQVQQSFAVGQGSQTITFTSTAPAAATVGGPTYNVTATASSGLAVTFTIDASAASVCSIAGSTVSFIGAGTCVIDANQAGNTNYNPAPQVQQSFGVSKNNQTITFTSTAPAGAVVAGPTYTVTATASSGLAVTFTIDASAASVCSIAGSTVSFTGVGNCVIDADQAGNGSYNPAPQVQQSFAVGKGNQTISFTSSAPAGASVGGPTYTVTATATSGLAVSFTIDAAAASVCSIAGSTVSFFGAGTCVIDANQAGNANYNAAPQVQQSFLVAKANQTISFTSSPPPTPTVGGATYTVTATATSGLAVAFTIDASATSVCSIAGSTVSFIGNGTCVIDANQPGNANYNAAPQVQQSFTVKSNQTITFTSSPPATPTVGGATYTVTATATSGLTVAFTIDASATSVCSIAGSTVSFIGAGTCVIDANQAGNGSFYAAPQVQQSFTVKIAQTITFTSTAPAAAVYQGPTYTVTATGGGSGNAVTFTIDASATSVCSIAGATVSFIGTGTCVIDANQAGNASYYAAPQVQQSFTVGPKLVNDSYSVVGNTQLVVAGQSAPSTPFTADPTGILANDSSDVAIVLTTVANVATTGGGLITIDASGRLTYTPPVGQSSGTDTYVYTGTSNGVSRTATITFNISNIVWFVDNSSAAATHDGRSNTPFLNMGSGANGLGTALAGAGPAANAFIYVFHGSGSTTGAYTFKANQTLIGAGATLTVGALTIAGAVANTPTLSGTLSASSVTGLITDGLSMSTGATPALNFTNSDGTFTFRSVSASGAANGIVWNNSSGAAATGSLTINGDGANTSVGGNGTGGTLSNMSGANGVVAGSAIYLNKVKNVTLRRMTINGTNQNFGIRGFQVNGFTLEYSTVGGTNGGNFNTLPDDSGEGSIYFGNSATNGLSTQGTFTNNNISGGAWDNLHIENTTAGTTALTVKGNTFGLNGPLPNGNQSFIVIARNAGTIVNSVVGGPVAGEANTFLGAPGGEANFTGQQGTTMDVQFKNNVLSNSHPGNIVGGGNLTLASAGTMTFVADSNTMRDANGSAITLQKADPSPINTVSTSFSGRLTNNSLGVTGVADSASKSGNGMFLSAAGKGTVALTIIGNQIRNWHGNAAMFFDNTGGSYTVNTTIQGNVMAEPGAGSFSTLALTNGANASADTVNVCAAIGGSTAALKNTFSGAVNFADVYLGSSGQNGGHTFNLPGYVGASNLANVAAFVSGNNTLTGGATMQVYDDNGGQGSFTGVGSSCPTP